MANAWLAGSLDSDGSSEPSTPSSWWLQRAGGSRRSRVECFFLVVTLVAMLGCLPICVYRAVNDTGGTDFPEFYEGGAFLLETGQRAEGSMASYYLPSVEVMWAALALMPLGVASAVWYTAGCVAWVACLLATDRYLLRDVFERDGRPIPRVLQVAGLSTAGLVTLPLLLDSLCLGAFHVFMLWWMLEGLGRVSRGRDLSGGLFLGLAIWLKLLPLLGVGYLVLKRKWIAAIAAVACFVVIDAGLSIPAYGGVRNAWNEHVEWFEDDVLDGRAGALLKRDKGVDEQRVTNQSLPAVLRRILTKLGYPSDSYRDYAALGNLTARQLRMTYFGCVGLILVLGAWYCRLPGSRITESRWATELALLILATLWLSPIAPSYHPIVALPALAVVCTRYAFRPLGWFVLTLWILAMMLHAVPFARAFGHVLWTTMIIGIVLVVSQIASPDRLEEKDVAAKS